MQLYLTVYERIDTEPEWFTFVSDKMPSIEEEKRMVCKNEEILQDEFDDCIGQVWTNCYEEVDGYKIKVIKE